MSLITALHDLRSGWWIGAICAGVGMVAALLAATLTPPLWTATTTLTVEGPDVQDTVTGFLVPETAARTGAEMVAAPAFLEAAVGAARAEHLLVGATVPFSTSEVVISVTGGDRLDATDAARAVADRLVGGLTKVSSRVAVSADRQRVRMLLPVRVRVVDQASSPVAPASPQPVISALVGAATGLVLGCAVALLRGRLSRPTGPAPEMTKRSRRTAAGRDGLRTLPSESLLRRRGSSGAPAFFRARSDVEERGRS